MTAPAHASPEHASNDPEMHRFLSATEARRDRWRTLLRAARAMAAGGPEAATEAARVLAQLRPLEELFAYPGPRLVAAAQERLAAGDAGGFERLVQKISSALLSGRYRQDLEAWEMDWRRRWLRARSSPRRSAAARAAGRTSRS